MHVSLCVVVLLWLAGSAAVSQGFRWWLDPQVQRDLALTTSQMAALNAEYDRGLAERRYLRRKFDAADAELTAAPARGDLSDHAAEALINRVEDLRRERNVARRQLLVTMHFLLTPEQRAKFPGLVSTTTTVVTRAR